MSANEEELETDSRGKRRRIQRACDFCRRRKIRCDGSEVPGGKCPTCLDANIECVYREATVKRAPKKNYVDSLEGQLDQSMVLINQVRSELAAAHFNGTSSGPTPTPRIDAATALTPQTPINNALDHRTAAMVILRARLRAFALPPPPPHGDDLEHLDLARNLAKLTVGRPVAQTFFGKGSGATLVNAVLGLKADVERSEAWSRGYTTPNPSDASVREGSSWTSRRMRFQTFKPWQRTSPRAHSFKLPPAAMINDLTELYFTHQNVYLPLLHRPTFERSLADGLHFTDYDFATTVILVCAVASRWSKDPEVFHLSADTTIGAGGLTCGWGWFNQVRNSRHEMSGPATLYDLQYYCLAVQFLECSSEPPMGWMLIGFGLRVAQDIGAHRRTAPHEIPSIQSELLKRAFWVLMYMDRLVSAGTGRTCALEENDVDVEMPIECDDEYWEHPTHPFQQPPGLPSKVTFFNKVLRLSYMLAWSLKLLYSLNKTRAVFDLDDTFETPLVAELDSALNNWYEGIPEHLRWDPQRQDLVFFNQSVALHCKYHHLQIYIHRRFIPSLRKSGPTGLPSLAVCTSAARACANMVDIQRRRTNVPTMINMLPAFTAGIVLLLNVWSSKRMGMMADPSREMVNVQKCMEVVQLCEDRWQSAGLFWDILAELASVGGLSLPSSSSPQVPSSSKHAHVSLDSAYTSIPHPQAPPVDPNFSNSGMYTSLPMEASMFTQVQTQAPFLPPDDFIDPAEVSRELGEMMNLLDNDTIAMWMNAPVGSRMEEWGNYFNDFSEITQGVPSS